MKLQVLTLQNRNPRTQDKEQAALGHALPHHGSSQDRKGPCIEAQSVPTALTQGQSRDPLPKACGSLPQLTPWLALPTGGTERKHLACVAVCIIIATPRNCASWLDAVKAAEL